MDKRDKLGRRVGRNWWREHCVDIWFFADHAWRLAREAVAYGYATEEREYALENPRPTFKQVLMSEKLINEDE